MDFHRTDWFGVEDLPYIVGVMLCAMLSWVCADTWTARRDDALYPGRTVHVDHTVGVVLRRDDDGHRAYRIFTPALADSARVGAAVHGSRHLRIDDVRVLADPADVKWSVGRGHVTAPGLSVHVSAWVRGADALTTGEDTVQLYLPALDSLGARRAMRPGATYNGLAPRPGSTVMLARLQRYPTVSAMQVARLPYLALAILLAALDLFLVWRWLRMSFPSLRRGTPAPALLRLQGLDRLDAHRGPRRHRARHERDRH